MNSPLPRLDPTTTAMPANSTPVSFSMTPKTQTEPSTQKSGPQWNLSTFSGREVPLIDMAMTVTPIPARSRPRKKGK